MFPLLFLLSASVKFNFYNSQYIDHVHPELGTFNHRFFSTWDQHFTDYPDSLIVFVGGNSPIDSVAQSIYNMPIFEIAKNTNSTLFILEHRFFGESKISNNTESESLEFLTVDQAIDDIAQFITFIKNSYCKSIDCRVALAGEGYGGSCRRICRHLPAHGADGILYTFPFGGSGGVLRLDELPEQRVLPHLSEHVIPRSGFGARNFFLKTNDLLGYRVSLLRLLRNTN